MTVGADIDAVARTWFDAGFCVVTTNEDRSKRPFGEWAAFQNARPDWDQVSEWLELRQHGGIGVITGKVSGNIEMFEIEGPPDVCQLRLARLQQFADDHGLGPLLERVLAGCSERSAGGSLHVFIKVTNGSCLPNTKLAFEGQGSVRHIIAETRGEGGFVVVAPTSARRGHEPESTYRLRPGCSPENVAVVTADERDVLYALIRSALDEPEIPSTPTINAAPSDSLLLAAGLGIPPWKAFATEVTWAKILEPAGWSFVRVDAEGRSHWTRPGKDAFDGTSATTREEGPLYVFSTSTNLPAEEGMSKAYVYAHYHHGGDMAVAARALRDRGFGDPLPALALETWSLSLDNENQPALLHDEDYDRLVHQRYIQLRVTEDAKRRLAADQSGRAPSLVGVSLSDFLDQPDEEARYRIQGLWPTQGRVLFAAAAKSGKTTLVVGNLIPSLVDNTLFLGAHEAAPVTGRVVLLNMEVGENVLRHWLRDAGIENQEKVVVANLRGRASALSLDTESGRRRFADWLTSVGAEIVILDPLAPLLASLGIDENSNADVARFFNWWTEALTLAGVTEDFIVHHTGHAGERSRGASRLLDEPDAIWILTKDRNKDGDDEEEFVPITPTRHLSAYGRDVDLPPTSLAYEESSRRLIATGLTSKSSRRAATSESQTRRIVQFIADHPGANTRRVSEGAGVQKSVVPEILKRLVEERVLEVIQYGQERLYSIAAPRLLEVGPTEPGPAPSPVPETPHAGTGDASGLHDDPPAPSPDEDGD